MAWIQRFANVFRGRRLRREIEEEIGYHLEARAADHRAAGMSAEDAHAEAVRRFGGRTLALGAPTMPTFSPRLPRRGST